jgi:hypothetical protein
MSDDDKGPSGYTVKDLVYWSGFIGGAIVTYGILHAVDVEMYPLIRAVLCLGAGVAVGWTCERICARVRRPPTAGPHSDRDFNQYPGVRND